MNHFERLLLDYIQPGELAAEIDVDFYRRMHPDLASFSEEAARCHYRDHGRREGRIASPAGHRIGFVAQIPTDRPVLEIGPAVRPVLRGSNIRYFDISTKVGLIERAIIEGYDYVDCPEIHYVSANGDLTIIGDRFSAVFSSHCIEHQPDLITHLRNVSDILAPGGHYFIIVPDKRYCFDALLLESQWDEVQQAYSERRRVHTWAKVLEHYAQTTHNDTPRHWVGDSADPAFDRRQERASIAEQKYSDAKGGYVDVHAWQFTPDSFRRLTTSASSLVDLKLERIHHPIRGSNEFFAVFVKP